MSKELNNRILLKSREICTRLVEDLNHLGIKRPRCPRQTLSRLNKIVKDKDILRKSSFLRLQDFLQRSLSREDGDGKWERGRICEVLLGALMSGTVVGGRGLKYDIISKKRDQISVKVYSGAETRVQGGSLPRDIDRRSTVDQFLKNWAGLFIARDDYVGLPLIKREDTKGVARTLILEGKPLVDLHKLHTNGEIPHALEARYKEHRQRRNKWRKLLSSLYDEVDLWVFLYISENCSSFDGYLDIHWFSNDQIINYLSPIDSPPPIQRGRGSGFRFNADRLKIKQKEMMKPFKSGRFYCHRLLSSKEKDIHQILDKRNRVIKRAESCSSEELDRILSLLK